MPELSKAEKLLVAAGRLAGEGRTQFSAEDLIVQAHREFPNDFSIKGYPDYPNSNAVLTQIMGKKAPLIVRGWLEKTGAKQYRLTPKGLHDLNQMDSDGDGTVSVHIERVLEESLGSLLTSSAYDLFKAGQKDQITFHQFCRFAGLSARDKWQKVAGKLSSLEHLVQEATKIGESGNGLSLYFRNRNYSFTPDDLRMLDALLTFVKERFKGQMDEWRRNALAT
jgi:hypothetical protein